MILHRSLLPPPRRLITGDRIVLALIACFALLLAGQQCAESQRRPSRLDAAVARDPLPGLKSSCTGSPRARDAAGGVSGPGIGSDHGDAAWRVR